MGRRIAFLKPKTEYRIYFYYPKGSGNLEDVVEYSSKKKAIIALKYYIKEHPHYDIKLVKETTTYEEVNIED